VKREWIRLAVVGVAALGGAAWCAQARRPPPAITSAPSASPSAQVVTPLLDSLSVGDMVGEWKLRRAYDEAAPNQAPQLALDFERRGSGVTVYIARRERAQLPPITTEQYAISYGHQRPEGEPIPPGSEQQLGEEIATRVRKNEKTAPPPKGL